MSESYSEILAKADQAVARTAATLGDDPQRPGLSPLYSRQLDQRSQRSLLLQGLLAHVLPAQSLHRRFRSHGLGSRSQPRSGALGALPHRHHAQPGQLRCRRLLVGQRGHSRRSAHHDLFRRRRHDPFGAPTTTCRPQTGSASHRATTTNLCWRSTRRRNASPPARTICKPGRSIPPILSYPRSRKAWI